MRTIVLLLALVLFACGSEVAPNDCSELPQGSSCWIHEPGGFAGTCDGILCCWSCDVQAPDGGACPIYDEKTGRSSVGECVPEAGCVPSGATEPEGNGVCTWQPVPKGE